MTKKPFRQHRSTLATLVFLLGMLATIRSRAAEGVPQPVQRLDPLIQKIVSEVSEERIAAILRKLRPKRKRR